MSFLSEVESMMSLLTWQKHATYKGWLLSIAANFRVTGVNFALRSVKILSSICCNSVNYFAKQETVIIIVFHSTGWAINFQNIKLHVQYQTLNLYTNTTTVLIHLTLSHSGIGALSAIGLVLLQLFYWTLKYVTTSATEQWVWFHHTQK